ncbi:MAG: hypothetical protein WBB85_12610 [Albidovulum sp.]|uniref:hypothetical protein n=1 Tax=Albidovulum sp. TaxID=1872424 RepID=UPI003CBC96A5
MIGRAHILPRKPLTARRPFGVLTGGLGRAYSPQPRAVAPVARHFRGPVRPVVARVTVPSAPGSRLSSVHHVTLAPRFEVMIRQYHAATERFFSSQVTTEVQPAEASPTRVFRPVWNRPTLAETVQPRAATAPAAPLGRSSAPGAVLHHHRTETIFAQMAPTVHPARTHTAPWRAAAEMTIAQPILDAPSTPMAAAQRPTALTPASCAMHARASGRAMLHTDHQHRRIQITTVANRHLVFRQRVDVAGRVEVPRAAAADRAQPQFDAPETRAPRELRRAVEVQAETDSAFVAPARTLRSIAAAQPAPAEPTPVPRSFRAEPATPAAPPAPAPTPKVHETAAPQAPQIDIAALDKVLWQRFEKRLRVETERRGRG